MPNENLYENYIDRSSPIPLYQQVSADMTRRIAEEEWRVGDPLISEITLAELYQVSRITMRQALARLEREGLISRKQGGRSIVQACPQYMVQDLQLPSEKSETPIVSPAEKITSSHIRIVNLTAPDRRAARRLDLPEDAPLVYLERYLENSGRVFGINRAWFPRDRFPDLAPFEFIEGERKSGKRGDNQPNDAADPGDNQGVDHKPAYGGGLQHILIVGKGPLLRENRRRNGLDLIRHHEGNKEAVDNGEQNQQAKQYRKYLKQDPSGLFFGFQN